MTNLHLAENCPWTDWQLYNDCLIISWQFFYDCLKILLWQLCWCSSSVAAWHPGHYGSYSSNASRAAMPAQQLRILYNWLGWNHATANLSQTMPNILPQFDYLFLIRVYWKPKSWQGQDLGCLASCGDPGNNHKKRTKTMVLLVVQHACTQDV